MIIRTHKNFDKKYKKLREGEKERFIERRNVFLENPFHPILGNHPLNGKWRGYRSINIGGDLRAVYFFEDTNTIQFVDVDTHSNLYR